MNSKCLCKLKCVPKTVECVAVLPASVMLFLKDSFPMERNLMVEGLVLQRVVHRLDRCKSEVCSLLLKLVGAEGNTRLKIELAKPTRFPFCVQKEKDNFVIC